MDIKERFQLFDSYVESIDGLSADLKRPLEKIARYVFEAETGIMAPVELDIAKKVGLLSFVRQIEDCLNPSNPQPLTDDIINQANNIALQIDELAKDPEELQNDDTSHARELVSTLPNTDARIKVLASQLKFMKAKVAGFNLNMTRAQRIEIEKDLDKIQNEIALYMNLGQPYDRIRTSLNQFDQAKQNAKYTSRKADVNQMTMDQQLSNQKASTERVSSYKNLDDDAQVFNMVSGALGMYNLNSIFKDVDTSEAVQLSRNIIPGITRDGYKYYTAFKNGDMALSTAIAHILSMVLFKYNTQLKEIIDATNAEYSKLDSVRQAMIPYAIKSLVQACTQAFVSLITTHQNPFDGIIDDAIEVAQSVNGIKKYQYDTDKEKADRDSTDNTTAVPNASNTKNVKRLISSLVSTQGNADLYDIVPSLSAFLTNVKNCREGHFEQADQLNNQAMQVQAEVADLMDVLRKELGNPEFESNIQHVGTDRFNRILSEYGIDPTTFDPAADKEQYQAQLDQIRHKAQLNREQLNNAKAEGAYYKDKNGNVHYTDDTIPEIIDDLNALSAQERDLSSALSNLDKLQDAYATITNVMKAGNWIHDVAHNAINVRHEQARADHLNSLKIKPQEFLPSVSKRIETMINMTTASKNDIFTLLAAIKAQNANIKMGRKSTVKNELKRSNATLDMTKFAVDQSGNFYFKFGGNLIAPLRVAYEMSVGGVNLSNDAHSFTLAEHLVTHPTVNGEKIERINENWVLTISQETPDSEDATMDITYKGKTASTKQSMMSADLVTMLREAFVQLGNTLPFCGEK